MLTRALLYDTTKVENGHKVRQFDSSRRVLLLTNIKCTRKVTYILQMIAYLKVKNSEQERIRQRKLKEEREIERGESYASMWVQK